MELPQCTTTPLRGSGQWNTYNAPLHRLRAVGRGTPAMRRHTCPAVVGSATAAMHGPIACSYRAVELPHCSATVPRGSRRWNSCNAAPYCRLQVVGSGTLATYRHSGLERGGMKLLQCTPTLLGGSWPWNSCNPPPLCLWPVGSENLAKQCHTACGQWAVELLQCTTSLPMGSGRWDSCNAPPHSHTTWDRGQWNPCNSPPHCLGQRAVENLQCTAPLLAGSGQWNSRDAPPHCATMPARSGTPTIHRHTTQGQWVLVHCRGSMAHCPQAKWW